MMHHGHVEDLEIWGLGEVGREGDLETWGLGDRGTAEF
jgi:hypothetical protein